MIELTHEQKIAHDAAVEFIRNPATSHLTIGGYAGTGKTTVTAEMVRNAMRLPKKPWIQFCCYTGKAASVLRDKLRAAGIMEHTDYCGTIHGLIYEPVIHQKRIVGWRRVPDLKSDLIIVDEASMVNREIWMDLLSYGKPIVAVGDHGQLPPIEGQFNLMEKPDYVLTTIHRQAEGNPIIKLATLARIEGEIPYGHYGPGIYRTRGTNEDVLSKIPRGQPVADTLLLCGTNRTRVSVNKAVRKWFGCDEKNPVEGERVICLRNNTDKEIFNGMGGELVTYQPKNELWADATIKMDDESVYDGTIFRPQFGATETIRDHPEVEQKRLKDLFDWGYCITVHKSQGSEADHVVLFEERFRYSSDEDWRRWYYTAVTRARKTLMIVNRRYDFSSPAISPKVAPFRN